ncbi:MAG: hypothetical protein AAF587_20615 [Bacteroidota bacterium]
MKHLSHVISKKLLVLFLGPLILGGLLPLSCQSVPDSLPRALVHKNLKGKDFRKALKIRSSSLIQQDQLESMQIFDEKGQEIESYTRTVSGAIGRGSIVQIGGNETIYLFKQLKQLDQGGGTCESFLALYPMKRVHFQDSFPTFDYQGHTFHGLPVFPKLDLYAYEHGFEMSWEEAKELFILAKWEQVYRNSSGKITKEIRHLTWKEVVETSFIYDDLDSLQYKYSIWKEDTIAKWSYSYDLDKQITREHYEYSEKESLSWNNRSQGYKKGKSGHQIKEWGVEGQMLSQIEVLEGDTIWREESIYHPNQQLKSNTTYRLEQLQQKKVFREDGKQLEFLFQLNQGDENVYEKRLSTYDSLGRLLTSQTLILDLQEQTEELHRMTLFHRTSSDSTIQTFAYPIAKPYTLLYLQEDKLELLEETRYTLDGKLLYKKEPIPAGNEVLFTYSQKNVYDKAGQVIQETTVSPRLFGPPTIWHRRMIREDKTVRNTSYLSFNCSTCLTNDTLFLPEDSLYIQYLSLHDSTSYSRREEFYQNKETPPYEVQFTQFNTNYQIILSAKTSASGDTTKKIIAQYDPLGNQILKKEYVGMPNTGLELIAHTTNEYDQDGRLIHSSFNQTSTTYEFNSSGSLVKKISFQLGKSVKEVQHTYNQWDQLLTTKTHDKIGNRKSLSTKEYDHKGQLVRVSSGQNGKLLPYRSRVYSYAK